VAVSKISADASVNNAERLADYGLFGGLFRPVYLETYPRQFIAHTAIDAHVDGSYAASVGLRAFAQAAAVRAELLDASGQVVGTALGSTTARQLLISGCCAAHRH